jgi:uncharacterized protein (TIGR00730 family)
MSIKRICVYCGSSPGEKPEYTRAARELGQLLVKKKIELVYGEADVGLMGEVANTVMSGGGTAIGVIPRSFANKVSHQGLTELHVVASMHERKQKLVDLADGFIALPGGLGTLEEIFEQLTWTQIGLHSKPCGILNVRGYFDRLLEFLDESVAEEFVRPEHRDMILVDESPEKLLEKISSYKAPHFEKWIGLKKQESAEL